LPGEYRRYEAAAQAYLTALDDTLDGLLARRIRRENDRVALIGLLLAVAIAVVLTLVARVSKGMLERERRALQIEKERAKALENELARRQAERARLLNEAQFRTIFDGSPLGIATLDRNGTPLERNPVLLAMLERFSAVDASFDTVTFGGLLAGNLGPRQLEREVVAAGGYSRWIDLTVFPLRVSDDEEVAAIAMLADATDRKLLSERLRYEARHDALTGLLSRNAFLADVAAALVSPPGGTSCQAVILIDLDRFKLVNDTQGHAAGDDVLRSIAKRLRDVVRADDVIARLHGDEFALFVSATSEADITHCVERAQRALRAPILIDGAPVSVDSSIGICIAPPDARADHILQNADTAMYSAKRSGRGRFVFFDGSMQEATSKWMRLASDMLLSLERGEFRVAYQPIVALEDASIVGFEALLRWNHHELGEISPVTFIPIAEETGAIVQLGRFVLAEASRQLSRWDWEHRKAAPVSMSVNLSVHQLAEYVIDEVQQCIAEAGIAGDRLILEITESALLESGAQTSDILTRLRASGVRLCLDDFGTGYSSLRYLQDFPIDQLKIDRSFVAGSDGSLASEPIVRMLINLAETMGVQLIAEGIESEAQCAQLVALGCRFGQGFLFSRPQAPSDFTRARMSRPLRRASGG
jgi:diguanylate cyclase (GGDEF)-like protein